MSYRTNNSTADHTSTEKEVRDAIDESKRSNDIVTVKESARARALLKELCDDSVEANEVIEFWGRDIDGIEWRVHMRGVA